MEFGEITQNNGYNAIQGHSRSPFLVPIKNPYATSYLGITVPISHRFRDVADYWSNFCCW